jgi:hypothetical protein
MISCALRILCVNVYLDCKKMVIISLNLKGKIDLLELFIYCSLPKLGDMKFAVLYSAISLWNETNSGELPFHF